jgi:hypothetical protein
MVILFLILVQLSKNSISLPLPSSALSSSLPSPSHTIKSNVHVVKQRFRTRSLYSTCLACGLLLSLIRIDIGLYDFAMFGDTNVRDDSILDYGVGGGLDGSSVIQNIWIEHTKCGMWFNGMVRKMGERGECVL